jgi:transcriptional regulator with XRE-family HTH domain
MILGERLRHLRTEKGLSQGDIEKKTNLLRCYLSRCENGHTVPSVATLEKWAGALNIPLYRLFYDGEVPKKVTATKAAPAGSEVPEMKQLRQYLAKMSEHNRELLLRTAATMARRNRKAA